MKSNEVLQREVQEAIKFEPLLHAAEIGVIVKDAIVTLTGNVNSLIKKTEALHATKKIKGVAAIVDQIQVIIEKASMVTDQQIAEQLVNNFREHHIVPKDTVTLTVEKGWVTLEGILPWNFQRDIARETAENQKGVRGVTNNIKLKRELYDQVEKEMLEKALQRHWAFDLDEINIQVAGATVQLSGTVGSIFQKEEAERIAYKTPGIIKVVNHLKVNLEQPYLC
ncbi:BON domain-containing protein [Flavobacterium sp. JLP]|uniref:BON domain-containing protein n=1 Tax=unclassified Flavobacterium TaxID=196869 RepID=UPI00188CD6C7|nr:MULTISPECIES: BON domain-containing protein [unclassified Flavobacterium]MBF4494247.1 BON domain-containing protein [Flavobacterium sp. MR2016-29]MBF4507651.1 BON domain-containing protein [Flavobacterium sp. JLP]